VKDLLYVGMKAVIQLHREKAR